MRVLWCGVEKSGRAPDRLQRRPLPALRQGSADRRADGRDRRRRVRARRGRGLAQQRRIATRAAALEMFAWGRSALGGLDGVVMNVGIGAGLVLRGTTAADWDRVMAVNLRAHFLGCKYALEAMGEDGGSVVLIGSVAAREVMPLPA